MGSKQTDAQKDFRSLIRESIQPETFNTRSYPNEYAARFLTKHSVSLSFLLPEEVKLQFMKREFEQAQIRQVVEAIAAPHAEKGITADWLVRELADAYLAENHVDKP